MVITLIKLLFCGNDLPIESARRMVLTAAREFGDTEQLGPTG